MLLSSTAAAHGRASKARLYPQTTKLTDEKIARWAVVMKPAIGRTKPSLAARIIAKLPTGTSDGTQNDVLALARVDISPRQSWYRVRLPILPNNTVGYVQTRYLSPLFTVHTHLYINRRAMSATLKRDGKTVFTTRVGIGKPAWPTPRGEFYIRDKLTSYRSPAYGPLAFGTTARSPVMTDWPAGGYVGIHGTDHPELLPGRVSHGCIRMVNRDILRLGRSMPVGTPVTVR